MKKIIGIIIVLILIGLGWHFSKRPSYENTMQPPAADQLLGTWIGVEGTMVTVEATPEDTYALHFTLLDGKVEATGTASDTGISFTRGGQMLSLVKGNGVDTGMKWLAEKTNCIVVKGGDLEGYCRDALATDPIADVAYLCDAGKTIHAKYYSGSVWLGLSDGRSMTLPQGASASGARYTSTDSGYVFWNKGNTAFLAQEGVEQSEYANCNEIDPNVK